MDEREKKLKAFLDDLAEVCNKHGLAIDGCGCCGSPYTIDVQRGHYAIDDPAVSLHLKGGSPLESYLSQHGMSLLSLTWKEDPSAPR